MWRGGETCLKSSPRIGFRNIYGIKKQGEQSLTKSVWRFKVKIDLLHDLAIPPVGMFLECKPTCERDTCILKFFASMFTIAKRWNQPRYPTPDN